jgi:pheromone shutdown protein TraB
LQAEIYNLDYNRYVRILGTTHFTKRSLYEAYTAVKKLKPTDLAIELDPERFRALNTDCALCPKNLKCTHKCEFIGAVDALGNVDANIWLIDMTRRQFAQRTHIYRSRAHVWRVLLDERDTLMAARLAWITSERLRNEENPNVLALVGAAHVSGIKHKLAKPQAIQENLREFEIPFTPPTLIRRIQVTAD